MLNIQESWYKFEKPCACMVCKTKIKKLEKARFLRAFEVDEVKQTQLPLCASAVCKKCFQTHKDEILRQFHVHAKNFMEAELKKKGVNVKGGFVYGGIKEKEKLENNSNRLAGGIGNTVHPSSGYPRHRPGNSL